MKESKLSEDLKIVIKCVNLVNNQASIINYFVEVIGGAFFRRMY